MFRLSVLIPCYNGSRHLPQLVDSLVRQSQVPDEIVVVDDGSLDESARIASGLPVRLIRHPRNLGPATARNTALEHSSGEIVLFVDSDTVADRDLVETVLATYKKYDEPRLAGIGGRAVEGQVKTLYDRWRAMHASQDHGKHARRSVDYLFGLCASYKRVVLEDVGGFDSFFPINAGEDTDLGYRLRKAGLVLRYEPQAIVFHQHEDDRGSLLRIQYNWVYWSYWAKRRSGLSTLRLLAGVLRRGAMEPLGDLLRKDRRELVALDLQVSRVKLKGFRAAARDSRSADTRRELPRP